VIDTFMMRTFATQGISGLETMVAAAEHIIVPSSLRGEILGTNPSQELRNQTAEVFDWLDSKGDLVRRPVINSSIVTVCNCLSRGSPAALGKSSRLDDRLDLDRSWLVDWMDHEADGQGTDDDGLPKTCNLRCA
jgi:hypothetical protein